MAWNHNTLLSPPFFLVIKKVLSAVLLSRRSHSSLMIVPLSTVSYKSVWQNRNDPISILKLWIIVRKVNLDVILFDNQIEIQYVLRPSNVLAWKYNIFFKNILFRSSRLNLCPIFYLFHYSLILRRTPNLRIEERNIASNFDQ
jgi:hypothetical protein